MDVMEPGLLPRQASVEALRTIRQKSTRASCNRAVSILPAVFCDPTRRDSIQERHPVADLAVSEDHQVDQEVLADQAGQDRMVKGCRTTATSWGFAKRRSIRSGTPSMD